MVELVVDENSGSVNEHRSMCATADSHHRDRLTSTMLEPATHLSANNGYNTVRHRDIPPFPGAFQPNPSLPLWPAPVQNNTASKPTAAAVMRTTPTHQKLPLDSAASNESHKPLDKRREDRLVSNGLLDDKKDETFKGKEINGFHVHHEDDITEKHEEPDKNLNESVDRPTNSSDQSEGLRNGVIESTPVIIRRGKDGSPKPRIIEDVVLVEARNKNNNSDSVQSKMVPPLRLKKIAEQRGDSKTTELNTQSEDHTKPETEDKSKYCIVSPSNGNMGAEKSPGGSSAKSIEIMIPSVPELGIKETRTDTINLSGIESPKPFRVVRYIVDEDVWREKSDREPQSPKPTSNLDHYQNDSNEPNLLSMPILIAEEISKGKQQHIKSPPIFENNNNNLKISSFNRHVDPDEIKSDWCSRRTFVRENIKQLRANAVETRDEIYARNCLLPDDSSDRDNYQNAIDNCDQKIHQYSNLLRKLFEANSEVKFERFCDEAEMSIQSFKLENETLRKIKTVMKKAVDEKLTINGLDHDTGEIEIIEQLTRSMSPKVAVVPNEAEISGTESLKGNLPTQIQTNGSSTPTKNVEICNKMRANPTTSPPIVVHKTSPQSQPRSVIVEPCSRTPSEPPPRISHLPHPQQQQQQQQQRSYSSFYIEDLTATPKSTSNPTSTAAAAASLRPSTYPQASRDSAGSRVPPNSPREALIASGVPGTWTDHHNPPNNPSATVTDVAATGHHQQHYRQQQQEQQYQLQLSEPRLDNKRPLDLAIKALKRPSSQLESQITSVKEDRSKRRRIQIDQPSNNGRSNCALLAETDYWPGRGDYCKQYIIANANVDSAEALKKPKTRTFPYLVDGKIWCTAEMVLMDQQPSFTSKAQVTKPQEYTEQQIKTGESIFAHKSSCRNPRVGLQTSLQTPKVESSSQAASKPQHQHSSIEVVDHVRISAKSPQSLTSTSQTAHDSRLIMAEQFPTLGNWAANLAKNQVVSSNSSTKKETVERNTPVVNGRQTFYPSSSAGMYRTMVDIPAATAASITPATTNHYTPSSNMPIYQRWTSEQHQQHQQQAAAAVTAAAAARSFPRVPLPTHANPIHRQPTFHSQISSPSFPPSYAARFARNLYESSAAIQASNWPAAHTLTTAIQGHPRMPAASANHESTAPIITGPPQRVPSLIPLPNGVSFYPHNQTISLPVTSQQPYYQIPHTANPQISYPMSHSRTSIASYPGISVQPDTYYTGLLNAHATRVRNGEYEQQKAVEQQQQVMRSNTPDTSRSVGRRFRGNNVYTTSSRTTPAVGTDPSTPIYASSSSSSALPHIVLHHQQSQNHQQPSTTIRVSSKASSASYVRSCGPTPSLDEANRTLLCSYCGTSNTHFACQGCETTFYCNDNCQSQHWTVHVTECPKKMPRLKKVG